MPSSYFDDIPLDELDVARRMVRFHEEGDVHVAFDSALKSATASREETHALLALASDNPAQTVSAFFGSENPFVVDEILRLNHSPWQLELIEEHWDDLSQSQENYLTQVNDISVRRRALRKQALTYFDDKPIDLEEVKELRAEWKALKKHEFARILSSALGDLDEDSRITIRAAIQEARERGIAIAFYNPFATTLVHDELIRIDDSALRTNVVDFMWLQLSAVQQTYLIEFGEPNVRSLISETWAPYLDNDQLVRLLTDAEYPVRIAAYVNGISDEAKRLLSVSGAIDLDNGNFSVLAVASDADLDVLRGEAPSRHPSRASNHPAGSERLLDGTVEHSGVPPVRSELELAIDSLVAPARDRI